MTKQVVQLANKIAPELALREKIIKKCLNMLSGISYSTPPPVMGMKIHRIVRELTQNADPYKEVKEYYNQRALALYPELQQKIVESKHPLLTGLKLALAGNIIDFGVDIKIDLLGSIQHTLTTSFAIDDSPDLFKAIEQSHYILYLGDNTGEIVFDKLFLEQFPKDKKLVYAVRGAPVINDATEHDAYSVGLHHIAEIINNGSDAPGTVIEECSPGFKEHMKNAELVIAKGQGKQLHTI